MIEGKEQRLQELKEAKDNVTKAAEELRCKLRDFCKFYGINHKILFGVVELQDVGISDTVKAVSLILKIAE